MLLFPPEVRLLIYQLAFAHDITVPLADLRNTSVSLLRTCRLIREEGAPIFYGQNNFSISALNGDTLDSAQRCPELYTTYIRHLTIEANLAGANFVDRLWKMTQTQAELVPTCAKLLHTFTNLQSLSVNLNVPHRCLQHHSQIEEILCQNYHEDCLRLCTHTRDQLRRLGKVSVVIVEEEIVEVSRASLTLRPDIWEAHTDSDGVEWLLWVENGRPETVTDGEELFLG